MKFPYCQHLHSSLILKPRPWKYKDWEFPILQRKSLPLKILISAFRQVQPWPWWGPMAPASQHCLKPFAAFYPFARGTIRVFGHPLGACHHRVVYLPQRSEIDWHFPISVLDLVMMGRYVYLGWFSLARQKRH